MTEPITAIGILSKYKVGEQDDTNNNTVFGKLNNIERSVGISDGESLQESIKEIVETIDEKVDEVDEKVDEVDGKVGEKTDHISVPFVSGINSIIAYLQTGYYHIHGESFVYPKYADPVEITAGAGVWNTTGTVVELIPASFSDRPFDLHWISVEDISTSFFGIIDIYGDSGSGDVLIGAVDCSRTANFSRETNLPLQIPQQKAGTKISAKLSSSIAGASSVKIKVLGHFYG